MRAEESLRKTKLRRESQGAIAAMLRGIPTASPVMEIMQTPAQVLVRLNEDLANGKTIVLSSQELDDPSLREQLPQLLEDLSRSQQPNTLRGPHVPGYTMLGEIGQGGMSTVYLARQDNLGRHVAIKIAPRWLGGGDRARRMLVQEAHAMARLSHPNIVVIHDIVDVDDTFAIAMEWVDGRTLTSLLRALPPRPCADDMVLLRTALGTPLDTPPDTPPDEQENFEPNAERHFVRLIRDIARATQTVHDNDLLHLDIKPSNVLVRRDGTPLLADFGVTRDISLELDQTRTFAGTPVYAAPEQLRRDDKNIGPRTDVYSLGVTLYETLARTQPLQGMDLPAIVRCIESGAMPRLSQKVLVSPDLENIVHKAIAPEPEHRYATAAEFANDLDAFLEHRPVAARPLRPMQRMRRWARNEPWKAGLAGTLAIVLPLIAGLSIDLAVQWPSRVEAEINSGRIQANRLKQDSFQRWLINDLQTSDAIVTLEEAAQFESTDSAIACILALANEEGWEHARDAIAKHASSAQPSLGMELFAKKVSERRSFFNEREVEALRNSGQIGDSYLVALDQVFRARDDHLETSAKLAQEYLEEAASLGARQDPLLLGLIGWFSARSEDIERYESSVRAMRTRWPDDPVALAWGPLAIEQIDPKKGRKLADDIIITMPQHSRGYELLAGLEIRNKNAKAALQALERAKKANAAPPIPEALVLKIRAANGDAAAAQQRLELAQRRNDLSMELVSTKAIDPELLKPLIRKIAELPATSPAALEQAYSFAARLDSKGPSAELSTPIWLRYKELYPDRKCILQSRFFQLFRAEKFKEAAKIAGEVVAVQTHVDFYSKLAAKALIGVRDYSNLARAAERWQAIGSETHEAAYYAALGHSRLGHYVEAAQRLGHSLAATVPGKSWYVQGQLEEAWLRCSPESPKTLHNYENAKRLLADFELRNPLLKDPHKGRWTSLVRGEVLLANGQTNEAIESFKLGLTRGQPLEHIAPRNYRELLLDALKRAKLEASKHAARKKGK